MADSITIHVGTLPWQPAESDTAKVAEYHRYDIPLVGVVRQAGVDYLFECFGGEAEPLSVWSYTILQPDERAALDEAPYDEVQSLVRKFGARPGVVALAVEGYGIVAAIDIDDWRTQMHERVDFLLREFDTWLEGLHRKRESAERTFAAL